MENAKFPHVPDKKVKSNCNNHHFDNVFNDDITNLDSVINHMLPSLNDNYYQDNYEQFMLDRADDGLFDPVLLFCNETSEDHFIPLIVEQEFSEVKPLVQVNDYNNDTIVVHKDVDVQEQECGGHRQDGKQEEEFALEDPVPLQVWDDYLVYDNITCSHCQVLREIMHANGTQITKLEMHGGVGLISHAILVNYRNSIDDESTPGIQDYQMIDFSSNKTVKEYIEKYLEERRQNGYTLLQDALSSFYEALCIGYDWLNPNPFNPHDVQTRLLVEKPSVVQEDHQGETSHEVKGDLRMHHHRHRHRHGVDVTHHNAIGKLGEANKQVPKRPRMELSVQRERTKCMVIEEFAQYFDVPLEHAIKKLRLCDTVVKKKLRSFGVPRWPYRKVKSLKRRISELSRDLEVQNPELRMNIVIEIRNLQQQVDGILSGNIDIIKDVLL